MQLEAIKIYREEVSNGISEHLAIARGISGAIEKRLQYLSIQTSFSMDIFEKMGSPKDYLHHLQKQTFYSIGAEIEKQKLFAQKSYNYMYEMRNQYTVILLKNNEELK